MSLYDIIRLPELVSQERVKRAEEAIRKREEEVKQTLAGSLSERDKEREIHKHDEAVQHFNALLVDLVSFYWQRVCGEIYRTASRAQLLDGFGDLANFMPELL